MAFLSSSAVKELVIQLLEAYAESTDNTIDDKAVELLMRTHQAKKNTKNISIWDKA